MFPVSTLLAATDAREDANENTSQYITTNQAIFKNKTFLRKRLHENEMLFQHTAVCHPLVF